MTLRIVNTGQTYNTELRSAAAALPPDAPVVVMIHGYRYAPDDPRHDPHRHILSLDPQPGAARVVSWPRALGFDGSMAQGLGVAFGWQACGSLRRAYARAGDAGRELAGVLDELALGTGRPVAMIGHSLGARVALAAMARAAPGSVGRVILMSAAEFTDEAGHALASPAGRRAEVVNITSRENDPFDFGMELILRGGRQRALGAGLDAADRNWLDIQIDDAPTLAALAAMGFPISNRMRRLCHWSPYLRDGVFDLYRALLRQPARLPLAALQARLPRTRSRRWSRLLALPRLGRQLVQADPDLHGSSA